jgi:ribosome-binding protein aMBF1 (putative translation factor)
MCRIHIGRGGMTPDQVAAAIGKAVRSHLANGGSPESVERSIVAVIEGPSDASNFSSRVRFARKSRGLSVSELERMAGLSQGALGRIEDERRGKAPRATTVDRLSIALDVPFDWMASGRGGDPFRKDDGGSAPAQAGA